MEIVSKPKMVTDISAGCCRAAVQAEHRETDSLTLKSRFFVQWDTASEEKETVTFPCVGCRAEFFSLFAQSIMAEFRFRKPCQKIIVFSEFL